MKITELKHNLATVKDEIRDADSQIQEAEKDLLTNIFAEVLNMEKELQQLDTEKWLEENEDDMFNNYPPIRDARAFKFEDMLRYFIDRVILGENQQ